MEEGLWEEGSGFAYGEIMHCSPRFTSVRRKDNNRKNSASNVLQDYNGADKPLYMSSKQDLVQRASVILTQIFWREYGKYTIPGLMHTFLTTIQIFITNQEIILQPSITAVKLYKKWRKAYGKRGQDSRMGRLCTVLQA